MDDGSEIVCVIVTTTGYVHDSVPMDQLIDQAPAKAICADTAYSDAGWRAQLRGQDVFARIRFNPRSGTLTSRQKALNVRWVKVRAKVEHVFAGWKERARWGFAAIGA